MDNTIMELIPDSDIVKRISKPRMNFIAEHGFSALIETGGVKILVDTGATGLAMEHNLGLLGLTFDDIDVVFLSHGHIDHTGGLGRVRGRVIAHPDAFHERFLVSGDSALYDLSGPGVDPLKHEVEFHRGPVELARGVMTTGEVPRVHQWEELNIFRMRKNGNMTHDHILDDQGVIANTARGLVLLAGCSHAGIINTIEHAKALTGEDEVYCVIGGFHLIGPAEAKIDRTIMELRRQKVKKIIPVHCTGFEGIKRISSEMPDEFEYCTVGCRVDIE
ncbi:MAG: MBL fold metallo-hydrolase [Nitrospirota bacterium]